jgi:rhodanese-related sulfurtransferase
VLVFYCAHGGNSMQTARRLGLQGYRTATVIGGYPAMAKWMENN